jgi:Leucine-rich repeat (LRR) protein
MRLPNISSVNMAGNAGMLAALPAHSLTRLGFMQLEGPADSAAISAALVRLSNLQQLQVKSATSVTCLSSPEQLTRLTQLTAEFVTCDIEFQAISQMQQLQHLYIGVCSCKPELLLLPAKLPALKLLGLWYSGYGVEAAAATAAVWPQLPQLRELNLSEQELSRQPWEAIRGGLAACTHLTKLVLYNLQCQATELEHGLGQDMVIEIEDEEVEVCSSLAGLTNLKHLSMEFTRLVPGDALALTALTGLTRLELQHAGDGVGDSAATAIASSCQQLQHLDLSECDLGSMACLAALRNLTQLTELRLYWFSGMTQQGLMMLTGLKGLQELSVGRNTEVTNELVESFWAALRQ